MDSPTMQPICNNVGTDEVPRETLHALSELQLGVSRGR